MSDVSTSFVFDDLPSIANKRIVSDETKRAMMENRKYTDLTMRANADTGISFTMSKACFEKAGLDKNSIRYGNGGGKTFIIVCEGDDKKTSGGLSFNRTKKSKEGNKALSFTSGALVDLLLASKLIPAPDSLRSLSKDETEPVYTKSAFFFNVTLTDLTSDKGIAIFELSIDEEAVAANAELLAKKALKEAEGGAVTTEDEEEVEPIVEMEEEEEEEDDQD